MRKCGLFIGHAHHNITKSSSFFSNIVTEIFSLDYLSLSPNKIRDSYKQITSLDLQRYDFVILWQIDWLAAFFLSKNIKTIIIPMYDSSGSLPCEHWSVMKGGMFINFSLHLHTSISLSGGNSCYVRYFPELNLNRELKKLNKVKAFFWERKPNSHINFESVARLLNWGWDSMHVHQHPDPNLKSSVIQNHEKYNITTSNFFETSKDYMNLLSGHNVYIAPRYDEGIGMGFLEAMARGQVVIAHDAPTHNEYITNFKNGILFNAFRNDSIDLSLDLIHSMQENIFSDALNFRDTWVNFYKHIMIDSIHNYIDSNLDFGVYECYAENEKLVLLKSLLYAHNDMEKYFLCLKLFNKGFVYDENKSFSSQALRYEMSGRKNVLINSLDILIEKFGENSPYYLFQNMLKERS